MRIDNMTQYDDKSQEWLAGYVQANIDQRTYAIHFASELIKPLSEMIKELLYPYTNRDDYGEKSQDDPAIK